MANNIQTIIRTAAMIYADDQAVRSSRTVKRNYCESILVNNDNKPLTVEQIIIALSDNYDLVLTDDEVREIIKDEAYFVCIQASNPHLSTYYLPNNRFENKRKKSENSLSKVIDAYIDSNNLSSCQDELIKLLYKYLYSLLNTNIKAFSQLLEKKKIKQSPVIDTREFSEDEIVSINNFLAWDNERKDQALFELICYCIEYASAINNIDQNDVVKSFKNKHLYLDNALIYRALGINGKYRKDRVRNLLRRCVDSGQTIVISSISRKEFFDSIDYHIESLHSTTPYGKINPSIFEKYSEGFGFYHYYHEWRRSRTSYGFSSFKVFIQSEYETFLKEFSIVEQFNQPYNEDEKEKVIEDYTEGIKLRKQTNKDNLHCNDACNILWIESLRAGVDGNVRDTKYYFLTPDRKLQDWDLSHSLNQPVTLLPSQWLALLLRFYSHTNNDFNSFVSFLVMPKDNFEISEDELQEKIAGISEITEDFEKQDDIVSSLLELERSGKKCYSREETKKYAKEKIEENYKLQLKQEQEAFKGMMDAQKKASDEIVIKLQQEFEKRDKLARYDKLQEYKGNLERQIAGIEKIKIMIDDLTEEKYGVYKRTIIVGIIVGLSALIFLIYKIGWDKMECITWILSACLTVFLFLVSFIKEKTLNVLKLIQSYKGVVYDRFCEKYSYSKEEEVDLIQTLEITNQQIENFWK